MRAALALLISGLAVWRLGIDWQATIGEGYAFRPSTLGQLFSARWPEDYANLVDGLHQSGVPYAWDPVGAVIMSLPAALVLAAIAGLIWVTRPRRTR